VGVADVWKDLALCLPWQLSNRTTCSVDALTPILLNLWVSSSSSFMLQLLYRYYRSETSVHFVILLRVARLEDPMHLQGDLRGYGFE
jgi:hypothetical protein